MNQALPSVLKAFLFCLLFCGLGILLMGIMTALVILFSGFSISWNTDSNLLKFLWGTLPLLPLAFMEELAFRGYPFFGKLCKLCCF